MDVIFKEGMLIKNENKNNNTVMNTINSNNVTDNNNTKIINNLY